MDLLFLQNTPAIQATDSEGTITVYHYSPETNDSSDPAVKQVKGWIVNTQTGDLLAKTFSYIPEYTLSESSALEQAFANLGSDIVFVPSYEGSIVNIWFDTLNKRWRLSTVKKLNAFGSRWGSQFSLGQQFEQCLRRLYPSNQDMDFQSLFDQFTSQLSQHVIYTFQLRSSDENRIVCRGYEQVECFYMGSFNREQQYQFTLERPNGTSMFESLPLYNDITDVQILSQKVVEMDPFKAQGILVMNARGDAVKIYNQRYFDLLKVRAFSPNHLMRYINILKSKDQNMLQQYKDLYSERMNEWKEFHRILNSICKNIQNKYFKRYVERQIAILPPEQHGVLKELYNRCWIQQRQKVTNDIVEQVILEYDAPLVHRMYEQFRYREQEFGDGNRVPEQDFNRLYQNVEHH
jgi:hypothetical protein